MQILFCLQSGIFYFEKDTAVVRDRFQINNITRKICALL